MDTTFSDIAPVAIPVLVAAGFFFLIWWVNKFKERNAEDDTETRPWWETLDDKIDKK